MMSTDNTTLFTDKADAYRKFRPNYADAYLDYLMSICQLNSSSTVADIGAGTGILTGQLLERGLTVIAVEPNDDMRQAAKMHLGSQPKLRYIAASAEHTNIGTHSVDTVTAGQAFHWFDPEAFREECLRILKPGGLVSLVWNSRTIDSEVTSACYKICKKYCPAFRGFSGGGVNQEEMTSAFFPRGCEVRAFENDLAYSREAFVGRYLSASYAPKPQDANYQPYTEGLGKLFDCYASGGLIRIPNTTNSYTGAV